MAGAEKQNDAGRRTLLGRLFDSILDLGKNIGMAMVLIAMLGLCLHVFMRYFFDSPINWMVDVSTLFMFFITFLGAAWLLREDGHVSLDFLYHTIGARKYRKVEIATNCACVIACLIVAYYGILEAKLAYDLDLRVDMPLETPKWIILTVMPVGFVMIAIEFVRKIIKGVKTKNA